MNEPAVITAPTKEAISLAELKAQCNIEISDTYHDTVLAFYRTAARDYFEWRTGRTIHDTTLEWTLDRWPASDRFVLPRATPLVEIVSIKYTDSGGAQTTWSSADYIADTDSEPGMVVLAYSASWPSFTAYPSNPIRVRYRAGIATASPIVEAREQDKVPILLLAAALFENREAEIVSDRASVSKVVTQFGLETWIARRQVDYAF